MRPRWASLIVSLALALALAGPHARAFLPRPVVLPRAALGGGADPRACRAAPGGRRARRPTLLVASGCLPRVESLDGVEVRHERVEVPGAMFLHVADAGAPGSPVCVLLHGFPDFADSWRAQIPAFAGAGFRVLCPDLRGYAESGKTRDVSAYAQAELTRDLEALRAHYCGDQPFELLVGHDWGGGVAYAAMIKLQGSLSKRLAVLNMFHPACFKKSLEEDREQQLKSWYIAAFQVPFLAETLLVLGDFFLLRRTFRRLDRPPNPEDLERHIDAFRRPGALNGGLNYYRAFGSGLWPHYVPDLPGPLASFVRALSGVSLDQADQALAESPPASQALKVPVLVLWGARDKYLSLDFARPPQDLVPYCTFKEVDATHWVHWDQPDIVNRELLSFLDQS